MFGEPGIEHEKDYRPHNFIIFNTATLNQIEIQEFLKNGFDCIEVISEKDEIIKTIQTVESHFPKATLFLLCNKNDRNKRKILKHFSRVKLKFI